MRKGKAIMSFSRCLRHGSNGFLTQSATGERVKSNQRRQTKVAAYDDESDARI